MRIDLQTHPKLVRILSATNSDKFRVIGGLHAVWSIFDTHTHDGVLDGYTAETLDHIIGWTGFSAALIAVDWLKETPQGLVMPEFIEHNGKSGKRRAEDQKRKRDTRRNPQDVRNPSADNPDEKRARERDREEDIYNPSLTSEPHPRHITDDFEPSEESIAYLKEKKITVEPPHVIAFVSHHQLKKTHYADERERQLGFKKWMANQTMFDQKKTKTGDAHGSNRKSSAAILDDATRDDAYSN